MKLKSVNNRHRLDVSLVDTSPGASECNPFSPPAGFTGSPDDYVQLLRSRFKDIALGQRMQVIARHYNNPEAEKPTKIEGPYRLEAWNIIHTLSPRRVIRRMKVQRNKEMVAA